MRIHIINDCRLLTHSLRWIFKFLIRFCCFLTSLQEVVGDEVVCLLVGNKTDLLEQQEDNSEQESTGNEGGQLTATLTRHPHRVLTTDAMKLAQVLYIQTFQSHLSYLSSIKALISNYSACKTKVLCTVARKIKNIEMRQEVVLPQVLRSLSQCVYLEYSAVYETRSSRI